MKEFNDWLNSKPGLVAKVCNKLCVNDTNVSNWRHGRKKIPWKHMKDIARMSGGAISISKLMAHRKSLAAN